MKLTKEQITSMEQSIKNAFDKDISEHYAKLRQLKQEFSVGFIGSTVDYYCAICTKPYKSEIGPYVRYGDGSIETEISDLVCPHCVSQYAPELQGEMQKNQQIWDTCQTYAAFTIKTNCIECKHPVDADGNLIEGTAIDVGGGVKMIQIRRRENVPPVS